jgi:hypothetical protein
MIAEERREKARLRSECWRRAHGIMPRRKAVRPWLAEGISPSTWYRRRKQARERRALASSYSVQKPSYLAPGRAGRSGAVSSHRAGGHR